MEQQRAEVPAEKHQIKTEFNEWEVQIGPELALEIGKWEYEAPLQREIEKEQTAILVEKPDAVDGELNIMRSKVNQGREEPIKQTQAVADQGQDHEGEIQKNSNFKPNSPSEKRASTRNRSQSRSSQTKT
jgi:hypothetical protein